MMTALLDTGPLVALFDPSESMHEHYRQLVMTARGSLLLHTTWPCVVEATHFLAPRNRWAMLDWVAAGGALVFPFEAEDLTAMTALMRRYTELPRTDLDVADASLLWVAGEMGLNRVLTMDVRDFSRFRLPDGRAFEIL